MAKKDQTIIPTDYFVEQFMREEVSPKFNEWRNPYRNKIAFGGRGAGAKSWSAFSLAVQFAEHPSYFGDSVRILVVRNVQNSIEESSLELIKNTVARLGYRGWRATKTRVINLKNMSVFAFKGLNDLVADNFKGYEDFDILIAEEAAPIGHRAWKTILPTFRKKGSEIWALFNRDKELDPVYELFVLNKRPNSCILELRPGNLDNPWFDTTEMKAEMEQDYIRDPDEAEHIWGGKPRAQLPNAIHSRGAVKAAMDRFVDDIGMEEAGVDVARFGSDTTQMVLRKGFKVIKRREMRKADTVEVAEAVWDFIGQRKDIKVKIDEGYNPGVIDVLVDKYGANVIPVQFGGSASDSDRYADTATEMWFELPLSEIDMPQDSEMADQLTGRLYGYDRKGRKRIESKDDYKKRNGGRSPDKADALILAFYQGKNLAFDSKIAEGMSRRRARMSA